MKDDDLNITNNDNNTAFIIDNSSLTMHIKTNPNFFKIKNEKNVSESLSSPKIFSPTEQKFLSPRDKIFKLDSQTAISIFHDDKSLKIDCEMISVKGPIWGTLQLNKYHITFLPLETPRPNDLPYILGALEDSYQSNCKKQRKIKQWYISNVKEVQSRHFNLRPNSFEIFIQDGKSYFFNLFTFDNQQKVLKFFKDFRQILTINDRVREFQKSGYTEKWINGEISNFEYLMILNTYSGRTYNDISQYPIFPWVIKDYESYEIDITTTRKSEQDKIFRDLLWPIGCQNETRRTIAQNRFMEDNPCYGRFHHGTHYSTAGGVSTLLLRLEPFTSQSIQLQGNKFDEPDRLFSSFKGQWDLIYRDGDVRELTPEFFYLPDVLKNK